MGYIRVLTKEETYAGGFWGWDFDALQEALHFAKYLQSPLPNWIASLHKGDSKVGPALSHIPMPDMQQSWTEQRLQQEFGFSDNEVTFLKSRVEHKQQHVSDVPSDNQSMAALSAFTLTFDSSAFMAGNWDWAGGSQAAVGASRGRSPGRGRSSNRQGSSAAGKEAGDGGPGGVGGRAARQRGRGRAQGGHGSQAHSAAATVDEAAEGSGASKPRKKARLEPSGQAPAALRARPDPRMFTEDEAAQS